MYSLNGTHMVNYVKERTTQCINLLYSTTKGKRQPSEKFVHPIMLY